MTSPSPDRIALAGGYEFVTASFAWSRSERFDLVGPNGRPIGPPWLADDARAFAAAIAQPADDVAGLVREYGGVLTASMGVGLKDGAVWDSATAQEAALLSAFADRDATIATLRRQLADRDAEVDRWRKLAEVPDDLRAHLEKAQRGPWDVEGPLRPGPAYRLRSPAGLVTYFGDPVTMSTSAHDAAASAGSVNHLRAQIAATATADHGGHRG